MKLNRILRLIRYQKTRICTVRLRAVSFSNQYKTIFEMAKGDISVEIKKREEKEIVLVILLNMVKWFKMIMLLKLEIMGIKVKKNKRECDA